MKNIRPNRVRLLKLLVSDKFFKFIVGLLVIQALWIAFSGRYPMAFDEDFHLGLIRLYADHISPFWSSHPESGNAFGALARDPSYLYHYIMSFPYRFISLVTDNLATQVVWLRMLNIALFASSLVLYRQLLLKLGASRALVHFCLLIFILVPIVPLLAAQINYDNLILPLTALAMLMTLRFSDSLSKKGMKLVLLWQLLLVCLFASLVKYAFLPIFAAIALFLILRLYKGYKPTHTFKVALQHGWREIGRGSLLALIAATFLLGGLFAERYGINIVRYQKPAPDCAQVLTYDNCKYYGPWIRDYNLALNKPPVNTGPIAYTGEWLHGMWFRSFFAVDGPGTGFQTRAPLTLPANAAIVVAILSALAFTVTVRRLWRRYDPRVLWLFSFAVFIHVLALWQEEYKMFLETHRPVAINGRYLLPILPLVLVVAGLALKELLARRESFKLILATGVLLCFLWGGGALTYILRSNDAWYWPGSITQSGNHAIQRFIGPLVPGYKQPTQYFP
jgi:hypothetical protein